MRECCATCYFGIEGDGETIHCNWTDEEMPKNGRCRDYVDEHPDPEYFRRAVVFIIGVMGIVMMLGSLWIWVTSSPW